MVLHVAARLALGPLLYRQAVQLRRTAIELPEPQGERSGVAGAGELRLRLLVAGDSSAAGVGARTQDEALAAPLARRLAGRLAGAVRWQLVAESGLTSEGVLHKLMHGPVAPADVAVVICGVNDITKEQAFSFALRKRRQIAEWLRAHAGVRQVLFPALPEMEVFPAIPQPLAWYAGQAARRNNRLQQRWARDFEFIRHVTMDGLAHPALFSEDGFHPAPVLYARVAERLSEVIAAETLPWIERQTMNEQLQEKA
jgi:lysophospholipase L1-like esterase